MRLRRMRRSALPWTNEDPSIESLTSGAKRPVEILLHESVRAPLTFGLLRPVILLPANVTDWSVGEVRRAVMHEMEHVRRRDWTTQLISRIACIAYWPHPLAWMALRRLCLEAERACDDVVVVESDRTVYAEQLVSLARQLSASRLLPGVSMARRSDLSARVQSILDESRLRGRCGSTAIGSVLVATIVILVAIGSVRAVEVGTSLVYPVTSAVMPLIERSAQAPNPRQSLPPKSKRVGRKVRNVRTSPDVAVQEQRPADIIQPSDPIIADAQRSQSKESFIERRVPGGSISHSASSSSSSNNLASFSGTSNGQSVNGNARKR